jgi:hypothetical protein
LIHSIYIVNDAGETLAAINRGNFDMDDALFDGFLSAIQNKYQLIALVMIVVGTTTSIISQFIVLPFSATMFIGMISLMLYAWWRMRKADVPGRNQPLFLAIGIVLLLLAAGRGGLLLTYSGVILLFGAFVLWLLAVTGYADKLLKTTGV